jgi:superfamily I DNA/RNA helicase
MAGARPSRFKPAEVEAPAAPVPGFVWSPQQEDIFAWFAEGPNSGNLIVRARAGTSKTTTALEGINRAPEPRILMCAFNKRIADELNARLSNPRAEAKTLHALGFAAIRQQFPRVKVLEGSSRANDLARRAAAEWQKQKGVEVPWDIQRLVALLGTKAREMMPLNYDINPLIGLAHQFGYLPDVGWEKRWDVEHVAEMTMRSLGIAADHYRDGIDFADMIFLPLVNNWLAPRFDLVVVDEAQDMTLAQLTLCERVCKGRMAVIGDDRQAIYGFRGADTNSLDRLKRSLGARELPLTVTYRCGSRIVERAQRLVPDICAREGAPTGSVEMGLTLKDLFDYVKPGDFILSRLNAPLVPITMLLLGRKQPAYMAGRDIGEGIEKVLRLLKLPKGASIDELLGRLEEWRRARVNKLANRGLLEQVDRLHDQVDMIISLSENALDADDLVQQCRALFLDVDPSDRIMCSSIHKAKGLESARVWVLMDTLYRRGPSLEEENLEYVAVTRAKSELFLVNSRMDLS